MQPKKNNSEGPESRRKGASQCLLGARSLQRMGIKGGQLPNEHCGMMLVNSRASLVQSSQLLPHSANVPWFNVPD